MWSYWKILANIGLRSADLPPFSKVFINFFFEGTEDENEHVKSLVSDDSEYERCKKEAIRLALKYNFVTDVTSMVVEEDDEYVTKKNLEATFKLLDKVISNYFLLFVNSKL